ncbi:MAG: hypothetical protein AAF236_14290 [Verrucomicrobiota bacterium]
MTVKPIFFVAIATLAIIALSSCRHRRVAPHHSGKAVVHQAVPATPSGSYGYQSQYHGAPASWK